MKLTSEDIKHVVAQQAILYNNEWSRYEPETPAEGLDKIKLWRRVSKKTVRKCFEEGFDVACFTPDYQFYKEYGAYFAWDAETILGDIKKVNQNCIVRNFLHKFANDGIDCTVLTDENDEQIIALLWASD